MEQQITELVQNQTEAQSSQQEVQKQVGDHTVQLESIASKLDQLIKHLAPTTGKENLNTGVPTPIVNVPNLANTMGNSGRAKGGIGVLPTPNHNGSNSETPTHVRNKLPKVDFPRFEGENPRQWLRKCHKYFVVNPMPNCDQIVIAAMYMDGPADNWYLDYVEGKENMLWEQFSEMVLSRFQNSGGDNIVGLLKNPKQNGAVEGLYN